MTVQLAFSSWRCPALRSAAAGSVMTSWNETRRREDRYCRGEEQDAVDQLLMSESEQKCAETRRRDIVAGSRCWRPCEQPRSSAEMTTERRVLTPPLPTGSRPLGNQVAGRFHGRGKTKLGFLQCDDGTILKPLQPIPGGKRELEFYEKTFDPDSEDTALITLRPLVPRYMCTVVEKSIHYIRMENVTSQFKYPSIMDIKIGRISYDPAASPEKIKKQSGKYKYVQQFGFQILGQRVFKPKIADYVVFDKFHGRALTPEQIPECLFCFFNGDDQPRTDAILAVIGQLSNVENWFLRQNCYQFFAVSLLVVYEGATDESASAQVADVRMIDFAHVLPTDQCDENFLHGLRQFKRCLESLLN